MVLELEQPEIIGPSVHSYKLHKPAKHHQTFNLNISTLNFELQLRAQLFPPYVHDGATASMLRSPPNTHTSHLPMSPENTTPPLCIRRIH